MKAAILAALVLAACGDVGIDFPAETGAPPRPRPSNLHVQIFERDFSAMPRGEGGAIVSGRTMLQNGKCLILAPRASGRPDYVHTVSIADRQHIEAHEMRHCTGQDHVRREVRPGVFVIEWLP